MDTHIFHNKYKKYPLDYDENLPNIIEKATQSRKQYTL